MRKEEELVIRNRMGRGDWKERNVRRGKGETGKESKEEKL